MKHYKVISFDIFQTLVDVNKRIPQIWQEVLGDDYTMERGQKMAECVLKTIGPLYEQACHEFLPMTEFYTICGERIAKESDRRFQPEAFAQSIMKNHGFAPYYEHVLDVMKELKQRYKIIISSDASHLMADPIVAKIQPDEAFISDGLGCYKGDWKNAFFNQVLEKLNIEPAEVLHIGDSVGDIHGAHLAGIDSCLVNRNSKVWTHEEQPVYEIHDFNDLLAIL